MNALAFLCLGESDWYHVALDSLGHGYDRFTVATYASGNFCACDGYLPEAPENTIGVEVHDAGIHQVPASEVAEKS